MDGLAWSERLQGAAGMSATREMALDMFGWTKPKRTRRASVAALTMLIYIYPTRRWRTTACLSCSHWTKVGHLPRRHQMTSQRAPAASQSGQGGTVAASLICSARPAQADASSLQVIDATLDTRPHSLQACRVKHCTIVGDRVFRRLSLQIAAPLAAPNSSPRPVQPIGTKAAVANYPLLRPSAFLTFRDEQVAEFGGHYGLYHVLLVARSFRPDAVANDFHPRRSVTN
jgi:hypothetical protein